ncbi:formate C-acetyltransferase/glycerol dehydratase family glycyl radical enzyme [Petroclostridium sp. X23]|uniref:glycyl radical protein n=1 Tax=Petroclostridium sp. X23 TaxID=3045146 RepID=UPI0024AD9E69|nr:formate C-acetyltransferase/glycerol dehydratase family glycyl radical enzyme [Petroclostridium sp. X23]WHH58063.1 formate C-acetyltransferase/glycerol dehydratase family glycyl radical enzyme [Petroclostridium sp. X23]
MNSRISNLREKLFSVQPQICPERARYFTESMKNTEGEHIAVRRAKAFAHVLENMSLYMSDGELIVGNQAGSPKASPVYPEYSTEWLKQEFNGSPYHLHERPGDKFYYTDETKNEIMDILSYWNGKSLFETFREILPEDCKQAWDIGVIDDTWVSSAGLGNVIVDYGLVLTKGLNGVIKKAEDRMAGLDLTMPGEINKYWFLQSVIIANKAIIRFANRFAGKCEQMAKNEKDEAKKKELLAIAENCRTVPANPVKNFWQAVQSVWFVLLMLHIETNGHAISLGRFDQYLYPFYKKDLEADIITKEKGLELIEAFFIKANELNKLRSWPDTEFFLGYQMFINLAVGGQTLEGKDAVNDVSHLVLEACSNLKLVTPSVSIKCFEGTDDKFLEAALIALQEHKGGQPAFYNDKAFMRILKNMGIKDEDLHNWAPDGCIEASIPGKWDFAAKGPWLNIAKILELTINNGKDPKTGIALLKGDGNLTDFSSTQEVMEAFKKQLHYYMERQVITEHINDELHKKMDINAFRSSLIEDCIERGMSLIEGGSVYSADGGPTAGQVTAGDSLAAVEYAVFKEKILTSEQLMHALETNFEDQTTSPTGEEIKQILTNRAPKYGNDNDEADKWVYEILQYIGSTYQSDFKNSRYGKGPIPACYAISQSPVTGNIAFGSFVGATPNGRKAGEPVNNGISPSNGAEKTGPTAAVNSVAKMPSIWFQKGAIFNMRLSKDTLTTSEGRIRAISLIKVLFEKYGLHVQFNVIDNDVLEDAKKHPEKYPDLMVRISGYSTLFVPLDPKAQDDLIQRVKFEL